MVGAQCGLLTPTERYAHPTSKDAHWTCSCKCGNTTIKKGSDLRSGKATNCGCVGKAETKERKKIKAKIKTQAVSNKRKLTKQKRRTLALAVLKRDKALGLCRQINTFIPHTSDSYWVYRDGRVYNTYSLKFCTPDFSHGDRLRTPIIRLRDTLGDSFRKSLSRLLLTAFVRPPVEKERAWKIDWYSTYTTVVDVSQLEWVSAEEHNHRTDIMSQRTLQLEQI